MMERTWAFSLMGPCFLSSGEQRQVHIQAENNHADPDLDSALLICNLKVLVFMTFEIISPEDKSYKYTHVLKYMFICHVNLHNSIN